MKPKPNWIPAALWPFLNALPHLWRKYGETELLVVIVLASAIGALIASTTIAVLTAIFR